ncbi:hypothetical protein GCM10020221_23690 [Streptomyces thioluteus]|uniref:Aminopeptidase N n=1 Tax=Streptomyces thioluteus TaxID=66431 RepID=A0ABN3WVV4_STRTU
MGAPSWFPCNDRPDDKASYTFEITVPGGHQALANGSLVEHRETGGSARWTYHHPGPMASYLAAVYTGRFARETWTVEDAGAPVPVHIAYPAGRAKEVRHDLARQGRILQVFTDLFGDYPFESYGVVVVDAELAAPVENQTLSVFGTNHMDGRRGWETLVAHETAHQWFGNSVSLGGLAAHLAQRGVRHVRGVAVVRAPRRGRRGHARAAGPRRAGRAAGQNLRIADPGRRPPLRRPHLRPRRLRLHALRLAVGDTRFFRVLRTWHEARRGGSADTGRVPRACGTGDGPERGRCPRPLALRETVPRYASA